MYYLYGFPTQHTKKVLYVLSELGVDYQYKPVDLAKGEQRKEEFLKKNPVGKVPVLEHNNETLFESGAICRYIANVENSALYPSDKLQRARVDQWLDFFSSHLGRWLSTLFYETIIKARGNLGEKDEKTCDEARKFIQQQSKIVDEWFSKNKFLTGNNLSIADLAAFAYVEQALVCDISLKPYPHLKRWFDEIAERESIKNANKQL